MAYNVYREQQPRTRKRAGNPSASDPTSSRIHPMLTVLSNARTHSRRLIETMKIFKEIDLEQVQKEYRLLMGKAGYKEMLQEEDTKLEAGSDADEEMPDASALSGGQKRTGALSAENATLKQELEETKLQLRHKELELSKKETEYNEGLRSIQEAFNSDQTNYEEEKRNLETHFQRLKSDHDALQKKHQETLSELNSVKKEKSDALTRLSKIMGTKLTDNNPSIADLSDQNRATKLGEKFAELYDDEWTDALETLTERKRLSEEKAIKILLDTLKTCFTYAKKKAEDQMASLEKDLAAPLPSSDYGRRLSSESATVLPDLPQGARKQLKDLRKSVASEAVEVLYQTYEKDLYRGSAVVSSQVSKIPDYVKKCLELCWLMAVQDPPVALGPEVNENDVLDTNVYRHYTTTGTHVDYVVWPPLCLHEGGPILCKGVAQPYPTKEPNRTSVRAKSAPSSRNVASTMFSGNVPGNTVKYTESSDASSGVVGQHASRTRKPDDRGQTLPTTAWTTYQSTAHLDPYRPQAQNNQYYPHERKSPRPDQQQDQYNQQISFGRGGQMPGVTRDFTQTRGTTENYASEVVQTRNTGYPLNYGSSVYSGPDNFHYLYGATRDYSKS